MSQNNKERHAATVLVHQIARGIAALEDMSPKLALENADDLHECFLALGAFLLRMGEREVAKSEFYRDHQ